MRKLFGILISLLLLLVGMGVFTYFNAPHLLSSIIEEEVGFPTKIQAVDFEKNQITIRSLEIANPKKARLPTALKILSTEIKAPYKQYIKNPMIIDEIHLSDIYMNIQVYNKDQTEGNWQTIIGNVQKDRKSFISFEKATLIKRLLLTNIQIELILANGRQYKIPPIEKIEITNISTEKGMPAHEITEIIVQKMTHAIFLQEGIKNLIETPVNIIKGVFPFLKRSSSDSEERSK
jgi:hypothetical protein